MSMGFLLFSHFLPSFSHLDENVVKIDYGKIKFDNIFI